MVITLHSIGLHGIEGYPVRVECDLSRGLPSFDIVGLPDAAVKESRERVRSAIHNCGFSFPVSRITVNLAPAHQRKEGTRYDLPILMGILSASGAVDADLSQCALVGEVSLTGQVRPVTGILPMAIAAQKLGLKDLFVPAENAPEATLAGDITIYPVEHVSQLIDHLSGTRPLSPAPLWVPEDEEAALPDFADVKGQENVKRAMEIAAAGGHHLLLVGPPGAGKSMLARRLPSILPDLTRSEALESTQIWSIRGLTDQKHPLLTRRPFRAPHHTISPAGLSGGGVQLLPGEISLAHNGVLFLDELPEFSKDSLEVLRQPLEEGSVQISRVSGSIHYPSRFMLVCAMNPCKCGWYGSSTRPCTCSPQSVHRYLAKISGPLLDRIDLQVDVPALEFSELTQKVPGESSADIRARVNAARRRQTRRYGNSGVAFNAQMGQDELRRYCALNEDCARLMRRAYDSLSLTARSYDRILRVARTIADLDGEETISTVHLAEAIQYRTSQILNRP